MQPMKPLEPMQPLQGTEPWWPKSLGDAPDTAGGQNELRYAYFANTNRLAINLGGGGGKPTVYDTSGHRISGASQKQGGGGKSGVVLSTADGEVDLGSLKEVSAD